MLGGVDLIVEIVGFQGNWFAENWGQLSSCCATCVGVYLKRSRAERRLREALERESTRAVRTKEIGTSDRDFHSSLLPKIKRPFGLINR